MNYNIMIKILSKNITASYTSRTHIETVVGKV